jgi:hypothetical protein
VPLLPFPIESRKSVYAGILENTGNLKSAYVSKHSDSFASKDE